MSTFLTEIVVILREMAAAPGFLQTLGATCGVFILLGAYISNIGKRTMGHVIMTVAAFVIGEEWLRIVYLSALGEVVSPRPAILAIVTISALSLCFAIGTVIDFKMEERAEKKLLPLQEVEQNITTARTMIEKIEARRNALAVLEERLEEE